MRILFFVLMVMCLAGAPLVAADANETAGQNNTTTEEMISINSKIAYSNVWYSSGTGKLYVTFHKESDRPQRLHLVDAGGFLDGGEINHRSVRLTRDETRVSLDVTEVDARGSNMVAMSVSHDDTIYAITEETEATALIGGPWSASDAQASAIGAASGVTLGALYVILSAALGRSETTERIA